MITNITLENFKCFRHVSVNPKPLTVLIGPNGTGKSSVLQALLLLKQSVGTDHLVLDGDCINLSGPEDVIPHANTTEVVSRLEMRVSSDSSKRNGLDADAFKFSAEFSKNLRLFSIGEINSSVQTGVPGAYSPVGHVLSQMTFVPAMRGFSRPKYTLGPRHSRQLPLHLALDGQEEQLAANLVYSRPSEEKLSKAMERVTETGIRAEMVPDNSVQIKSMTASGTANIVAEGSGTNALILPFHQIIEAGKGATVLIEEPEIHLHPKAQAELAEVLAETAKAEDKQIIMTTHSEHLVERLLTLVAEGKLTTDDLAIYSFEKDEKGECSASELVVTELGQTESGLTGFFDNNLAEMDRYVKALQNRS